MRHAEGKPIAAVEPGAAMTDRIQHFISARAGTARLAARDRPAPPAPAIAAGPPAG
jgi:hypothetical protein